MTIVSIPNSGYTCESSVLATGANVIDNPTPPEPDLIAASDCGCGGCGCCGSGAAVSAAPVRYSNGEVQLSEVDLAVGGFGAPWSHERKYSNRLPFDHDYGIGNRWHVSSWGHLKSKSTENEIVYIASTGEAIWFEDNFGSYAAKHGAHHTLTHDSMNEVFILSTPDGQELHFHDFDQTSNPKGLLKSVTSPGGLVTSVVSYTPDDRIAEFQRSFTSGGSTTTESIKYDHFTSGDHDGRVQYVTLRRKVDAGSWTEIRRAEYEYYGGSESHGSLGDLKRVKIQTLDVSTWKDLEVFYYRYYKDGDADGAAHDIKFVVNPESYQRLDDAVADPLTATDAQVDDYADHYFEYDAAGRVVVEKVEGGSRTFSFAYTTSDHFDDYNNWKHKTVETLPDGNTKTIYTNYVGQVLIEEFKAGSDSWIDYHKFDVNGREIQHATPAAVTSYDEDESDLNVTLKTSDGLIHVTDYYTTTGSGAAEGHVQFEKIKKGSSGSEIKLRAFEYTSRTAGDVTIYPVSKETVYRNDDGTGAIDTSYSYTWHTGAVQMEKRTTTLPAVPTSQNGSGSSNTREEVFDINGNLEWEKDERGVITRYVYDTVKGVVTQIIQDVDTTQVTDEPSGWSTPSGFGLHLVTDYEYDDLSRQTQELGPEHSIDINGTATTIRRASWTVYHDDEHEVWSAQGYAHGAGFNTFTLVNPVSISKMDRAGRVVEETQATRASTSGKPSASDTFAQSSYVRWTTHSYTDEGDLEWSRVYHTIPTSGTGSSGTNYDQTDFAYDSMGRQNMHKTPGGTITRTVFDDRGNAQKVYVGTDDTGATESDPTGGGAQGNNMVLVTEHEYDSGNDGGNGNLTKDTQHVDSSTTRVTTFGFNWRDQQTSTDGEADFYQESTYDNLDQVTKVDQKDTTSTGNLVARSETKFDDLGRVYQSKRYAVDVSTGTVGNALTDDTWYDEAGNVLKQKPAGSEAFTKSVYDGLGRQTKQFVGFDTDETAYADADDVVGDTIFEQTETDYDDASNVIESRLRRRHHDATGTGELTTPGGSQPKARVSYVASWPDAVGREIAEANYGTNADTALSRPSTVPSRSDTVLVTETEFNDNGEAYKTIDPAGREDRQEFDDAGRQTKTIENYDDGDPTTGAADKDRTVEYAYNADGLVKTITAKQQLASDDQVTKYVYGTTLTDSDVARSDLLRAEIYPDSDDADDPLGDGTDSTYDRIEYKYNRQGERKEMKDQNGSVHVYEFDKLGRQTHDRVTTLAGGVDGAIRRISTTFEVRGLVEKITSYDNATVGSGNVVNEVEKEYNDFAQLETEYQEHGAAVNTSTSPKVQYSYADGSNNHIRRTKMTCPNGRILRYEYDSGDDDNLSRVSFLADDDSGSVGTHLAEYTYIGLGSIVQVNYTEPDLRYDLAHGSGNDPYDGLDRFDRMVDLLWRDYGASSDAVRIKHGYDRASNRLWREDPVADANGKDFDELYSYDGLYQLTDLDRGDLNANKDGIAGGTLQFAEEWSLDPLGNWSTYKKDDDGDSTWDLDQSRSHNKFNEITDIDSSSSHVAHDRNGNMTKVPKPDDWNAHFDLTYDGWNRLVKVEDGTDTVAEHEYDGWNHRLVKKAYSGGTLDHTRHYYYSDQWQVMEERKDSSSDADRQFVWGLRYIDDLVLRDRDADDSSATGDLGISGSGLEERLYCLQDPNWNVIAVVDGSGDILERYGYDAYGRLSVANASFVARSSSQFNWETFFAGYRYDGESRMHHVRRRYFVEQFGGWTSRDPLLGVNGYSYGGSAPIQTLDPTGTFFFCSGGTAGFTVVAPIAGAYGYGLSFSVAGYFCLGWTRTLGWHCGRCYVASASVSLTVGGYASIGGGPSVMFGRGNRPQDGFGLSVGFGAGVQTGVFGVAGEVTVDYDLVSGVTTISFPRFGLAMGGYLGVRVTGSCTGCNPGGRKKVFDCIDRALLAVGRAIRLVVGPGPPYRLNRDRQVVLKDRPADYGDLRLPVSGIKTTEQVEYTKITLYRHNPYLRYRYNPYSSRKFPS